jgi:hypothetical protein
MCRKDADVKEEESHDMGRYEGQIPRMPGRYDIRKRAGIYK